MQVKHSILLIDNNEHALTGMGAFLHRQGYEVFLANTLKQAAEILGTATVHLIITDLRATNDSDINDRSGLSFARTHAPNIPKIILTAFTSVDAMREALQPSGDILHRPVAIRFLSKTESLKTLAEEIAKSFAEYVVFNYSQFKVGGALIDKDKDVYIPRQAESEAIICLQRMDYLLIIEPRQQGKTSLINYILRAPELADTIFVYIDLSTADRSSQAAWYESVCKRILQQLQSHLQASNVPVVPRNTPEWRSFLSSLILSVQKRVAIVWDEAGTPIPDAEGVFSVLRDIFNSRQAEMHFRQLTFLLVGAFHPRDLVKDDNISPFNIARRVRLPDFTLQQTWQLVSKFALGSDQADLLASRIFYWVAGQPYLTQVFCSYLHANATVQDVDQAIEFLKRDEENHLPPLKKRVHSDPALNELVERVSAGDKIRLSREISAMSRLELLGVIKSDFDGNACFRNRIYEQFLANSSAEPKPRETPRKKSSVQTILFLAAEPTDASRLRLGQELREIQEKLQMAKLRNKFNLRQRTSVRPFDISQSILDENPQIVHFSGHGTGAGELCFEDEMGRAKPVNADALGSLFALVATQVQCVLLNACYSAIQARAIAKHIQFVIGMNQAIGDKAAVSFAIGFYQALGAGKSIYEAYEFGCVQIKLQGIPEHLTPVLIKK